MFGMGLHFSAYSDHLQVIDEKARILVDHFKEHCEAGTFDATKFIVAATLDTISEIGWGVSMNTQITGDNEYSSALHRVIDSVSERTDRPFLLTELSFFLLAPRMRKKQNRSIKSLHRITENIIDERKTALQKSNRMKEASIDSDPVGIKQKANFLDVLLQATEDGQLLSRNDIRQEVEFFTFAGHDTGAACLLYTMYCLSRYPDVQNKAFEEVRRVMGDDLTKPEGLQELNELIYMELVLKEALRLYPVVPMITRLIDEDIHIESITLAAHSTIIVPIGYIHRNPDVYPNPEKFIPERFALDAELEKLHPYSFLGFSAGPRNCRGQKFAMMEMKCFMSWRNLELLPMGKEPQLKLDIVIKSTNGIQLGVRPRVYS